MMKNSEENFFFVVVVFLLLLKTLSLFLWLFLKQKFFALAIFFSLFFFSLFEKTTQHLTLS